MGVVQGQGLFFKELLCETELMNCLSTHICPAIPSCTVNISQPCSYLHFIYVTFKDKMQLLYGMSKLVCKPDGYLGSAK